MGLVSRVVAVVVGAALFTGLLLAGAEIALAGIGREPWVIPWDEWRSWAVGTSWEASEARWLFVLLAASGVVLLQVLFARRRPAAFALRTDGLSRAELSRRSVEQSLARSAERFDGVAGARAHIRPKLAPTRVTTHRKATAGDLRPQVTRVANERLAGLGLTEAPPVAVDVNVRNGAR